MPLTRFERKERLGFGGVKEIAGKVGCSEPLVSQVINDRAANTPLTRKVKVAVARRIGLPVDEVFPPEGPARQMVGLGS